MLQNRNMLGCFSIRARWLLWLRLLLCTQLALMLLNSTPSCAETAKPPQRLIDQQPFDRVTLNTANGNETIDTLLLDFPIRRVPNPFPESGSLELRRLSEPSVLYKLPWSSIERIDLFEQLLLAESVKLAQARDLTQAYEYLNFLHKNYSDLPGLDLATEKYLRQDALAAYRNKNHEEALTILLSLYDLNPQHQGLNKFVEAVTDKLIAAELKSRNFAAARSVLDLLETGFPKLKPANLATWQGKFEKGAARQLTLASKAIDQKRFLEARRSIRQALAILPKVKGAVEMLTEIDQKSPLVVVGVDQLGGSQINHNELDWSARRIAQLTDPKLLNLVGFGAEGGDYECEWASVASDDTGLQLDVNLRPEALRLGISTEVLALELLRQSDPSAPEYRADFAGLLDQVEIQKGNLVSIHWRRSHVRPEALLPVALKSIMEAAMPPGAYQPMTSKENELSITYQLPKDRSSNLGPETISEQFYDDEEVALADLIRGEVDVLARVPPWQVNRLQQTTSIAVAPYRLPTIHVLLPNYSNPIMGRREFRRALCYGIDRPQILNDILLGGENRAGFRVLSGPLPAGITLTDPVGYAYNQGIQPRTYEPRLASVLGTVARNSLARKAAAIKQAAAKQAGEQTEVTDENAEEKKPVTPPATPLVLAHPPNAVATTVCQSIKLQLNAVGIPIKLKRLSSLATDESSDYDLRYAELAVWEPIVDARQLLGPQGLAGNCSASMSLALRDVDQAKNWKQARSRLQEVHQIAFYDLPVIPLWQTIDYFAYRKSMQNIGAKPVTLYQNVAEWQRTRRGVGR